jgi:hypothetical protein
MGGRRDGVLQINAMHLKGLVPGYTVTISINFPFGQ